MNRMTEQDEFLLSQLLDGDLPGAEADALRARIAREPQLRAEFESLQRLNGLLLAQRPLQPRLDYGGLRADIMDAVHASRRPSIIRFPLWTWAAGAVAAAAAVALVFWVSAPASRTTPTTPGPAFVEKPAAPTEVVPGRQEPSAPPRGTMLVQFNRPRAGSAQASPLKVDYVRSDQLASEMSARDQERRSRPTWHTYVAQRARKPAAPASPFDLPL